MPLIHQELKRKGVTLQLLWEEYEKAHGQSAYRYSQFCVHYHEYRGRLARSMRQVHRAGEKVFIDYSGDTVAVIDAKSGEILTAEIFVATLGASKYAYAEATWTQRLPDWIGSTIRMLEFFGAVPSLWMLDFVAGNKIEHGHVRHTAVVGEHAPVRGQPVAALHVLGRPCVQQLAEAQTGDKDPGATDLPRLELHPLDRVACVIDLHALAGRKLSRRDAGLSVLWELAVKLLPEVRVRRQVLGTLLPQELQRMAQPQIVNDRRPVQLPHPQRIGCSPRHRLGRALFPVTHLPYRAPRAAQRLRNLPEAAAFGQPPLDLLVSIHRELPPRHVALPFVPAHDGTGLANPFRAARAGGPNPRKSGGYNLRKSGGTQPRKSPGPNQRKFCN